MLLQVIYPFNYEFSSGKVKVKGEQFRYMNALRHNLQYWLPGLSVIWTMTRFIMNQTLE